MQNCTDSGIPCFCTPQPNIDVPLKDITVKVHKYTKNEIDSADFWFVSNILSFPSVICVDKRD